MSEREKAANGSEWVVIDYTTLNQLGEFATQREALAYLDEIRPHGRFGVDGHDLRVEQQEAAT